MSGESAAPAPAPLALHRVRFVDWTPSSITALAFSPQPPATDGGAHVSASARSALAIGRENGNIDLCTWCEEPAHDEGSSTGVPKGWVVEATLLGDVHYKIEALAFVRAADADGAPGALRLFSTSGGSIVTEHYLPASFARMPRTSADAPAHAAPTRTLSSQGGAVWSLAASPLGRFLAIGCEDGIVRLIDISEGRFEHAVGLRTPGARAAPRMSRVANRIVSLAWGPPRRVPRQAAPRRPAGDSEDESSSGSEEEEDTWMDSFLLGGLVNSTAAVWDVASGQLQSRLALLKNRSEHTIAWSAAVLADGTLVTGDSTGRVTFFDARTRVPLPGATFQCHTAGADVLALCVGPDGRTVYSAAVDQKVAEYAAVAHGWVHTGTRRLHAHDIRALAIDPPFDMAAAARGRTNVSRLPVLVSGGMDFSVVMTPASPASQFHWRTTSAAQRPKLAGGAKALGNMLNPISSATTTAFADTTQRRIPFVPLSSRSGIAGGAVVGVCAARRWIVLRRDQSVGIWALPPQGTADSWAKVAELQLRLRSNLVSVALSPDGRFLAASDAYETKLLALDERDGVLAPRRLRSLGEALRTEHPPGASVLTFTPDSSRLVLATLRGAFVHVLQLPTSREDNVHLLRSFGQHRARAAAVDSRAVAGDARTRASRQYTPVGTASSEDDATSQQREVYATVVLATVAPDGQWLLTVDSARRMHVFHLDTLAHHQVLASPAALPTSASFHPQRPSLLMLTLPTNTVRLYQLDADAPRGVSAEQLERELRAALPAHLGKVREPAVGGAWLAGADPAQGETLLLYGPTWLCTARRLAAPPAAAPRKRRNSHSEPASSDAEWHVRVSFKYQPLLYAGVLSDGAAQELLVIERPYFALAQTLPPAFYRGAKYGF